MSDALLVRLYRKLPKPRPGEDPELWSTLMVESLGRFHARVSRHYTEGTLQRLLQSREVLTRRAAVVALSFVGTMDSNSHVASMLHDEDGIVREHASDALWEIWFRGGTNDQNELLLQILSLADFQQILENLNELIRVAPNFSEAWNQRAILYFRRGDYLRAIHDCEKVLQLNPFHFGAQAGMGQAWLKLRRYRSALRAFEMALQINPTLDDLRETIRDIRQAIEEDS